MGKEQTGREKGRGLNHQRGKKEQFWGRKKGGGHSLQGEENKNHRPQNIAVHLMAGGEGAIQGRQIKIQLKSEVRGNHYTPSS